MPDLDYASNEVMNQNSIRKAKAIWKWGLDEENCIGAARAETKPARLARMAADIIADRVTDSGVISNEILLNKKLPLFKAFHLAKHWVELQGAHFTVYLLALRRDATPQILQWCVDYGHALALECVAAHPNTTSEMLERMARSNDWPIVRAACASGRLCASFLHEFAGHDEDIYRELAAEFAADPELCQRLTLDGSKHVRAAAFRNEHTTMSLLNAAVHCENDQTVLAAVASRLTDPALLWKLADKIVRPSPLADAILKNPHSPDEAKVVATLSL